MRFDKELVTMLMEPVQSHIVPWGLPREDIPFNIRLSEKFDFDHVEIEVPADMQVKELINVGRHEISRNIAKIFEVKQIANSPRFFGAVVSTNEITKELKESREVKVKFYKEDHLVHEEILQARVFRPLLQLVEAPKKITLEAGKKQEVPLTMRYVGFGDINIKIMGRIGGRLVTRGKSFVYDLIKRIVKAGIESDAGMKDDLKSRAFVSPEFIKKCTQDVLEILKQPTGDPEVAALIEQIRELFEDEHLKQKMEEIVYSKVEDMILSMIVDLYIRRPVNNVQLAHGETTVEALLSLPIETLILHITYSDTLGNQYPEINVPIQIETRLLPGQVAEVEIPIKMQQWQHEPFLNVKEMKI